MNNIKENDHLQSTVLQSGLLTGTRDPSRSILAVGRASSSTGKNARELAVNDLLRVAEVLQVMYGIEIVRHLPSKDILMRMLAAAPPVTSHADGRTFRNRFVEIDLRAQCGVYFVLSTGSAKKVDDDTCAQPFVERLAQIARRVQPWLLMANRLDRVVRLAWALGPIMMVLASMDALIGDSRRGVVCPTGIESLRVFFDALIGEEQAAILPRQTRAGMRDRCDSQMVNGRLRFHANRVAPPGFTYVRMKTGASADERLLVLDSPKWFPPADEVAYGLPEVKNDAGELVDQVENIRWLLRNIARPGMTDTKLGDGLLARRFSTDGLRRLNALSTCYADKGRRDLLLHSVLDNLEIYRTGTLKFDFGIEGIEPVTVTGLFPPDGPWATPKDFARIDQWKRARAVRRGRRAHLALAGLQVTVNGASAALVTAPPHPDLARGPAYRICEADLYPHRRLTIAGSPALDAHELAKVIATSIAAAGAVALPLVEHVAALDAELITERRRVAEAESLVSHHRARQDGLYELLQETNPDGTRTAAGELGRRINDDYNAIADRDLPSAIAELERSQLDLDFAVRAKMNSRADIEAASLAHLVASLRDPKDRSFQEALRRNLSLQITHCKTSIAGHGGTTVEVTGGLAVDSPAGQVTIPINGGWQQGSAAAVNRRVEAIVAGLAGGIPLQQIRVQRVWELIPEVASRLEVPRRQFMAVNCQDRELLRIGMAARHLRRQRSDADIATELGVDVRLVTRVGSVWASDRRSSRWLKSGPARTAGPFHVHAATHEGHLTYEAAAELGFDRRQINSALHGDRHWHNRRGVGYTLDPCTACGSHARVSMVIYEPVGLVCLNCRLDEGGLLWPADPYDRYLPNYDHWVAAGLAVPGLVPAVSEPARMPPNARRAKRDD